MHGAQLHRAVFGRLIQCLPSSNGFENIAPYWTTVMRLLHSIIDARKWWQCARRGVRILVTLIQMYSSLLWLPFTEIWCSDVKTYCSTALHSAGCRCWASLAPRPLASQSNWIVFIWSTHTISALTLLLFVCARVANLLPTFLNCESFSTLAHTNCLIHTLHSWRISQVWCS